jgi:hypothetical protein
VDCVGFGMDVFGTDPAGVSPVRKDEGSFDFAQDGHPRGGFWGVESGATRRTAPKKFLAGSDTKTKRLGRFALARRCRLRPKTSDRLR